MTDNDFNFEAGLGLSGWNSNIAKMKRDADSAEKAVSDLGNAANTAEREINTLNANIDVKANFDDSELRAAQGLHNDLNTNTSFTANAEDGELRTAAGLHDELNTNTNSTVKVNDSELSDVQRQLETLRGLATIHVLLKAPAAIGGLAGVVSNIPGVSSLLEYDTALGNLEGRTGRLIPQAEHLIRDLYTNAWGDSITAINDVVAEAANLGIANEDIQEVVKAAFFVTDVTGGQAKETIRAMDTLVKTGLVPTYTAAADLLTAGFQGGADRAEDLLETFDEYGTKLADLKITGPGTINLINDALDNGVKSSDFIVDAVHELGTILDTIGTDENIAKAFGRLDELSDVDLTNLFDQFKAGEISGDTFFDGFFNALNQVITENPDAANEIGVALIGTKFEDLGATAFENLSTQGDITFASIEGRAEESSTKINNNLATLATGLARTVDDAFATIITDNVDVDAILNDVKTRLATFTSELQGGESIFGAAGIALDIDPQAFSRLESILTNLAIDLTATFASILEFLGKADAASGLRSTVEELAATQLTFDLQLAQTPEEIGNSIATAVFRGLDDAQIAESLGQATQEQLTTAGAEAANAFRDILSSSVEGKKAGATDAFLFDPDAFFRGLQTGFDPAAIVGTSDEYVAAVDEVLTGAANDARLAEASARFADAMFAQFGGGGATNTGGGGSFLDIPLEDALAAFDVAMASGDFQLANRIASELDDGNLIAAVGRIEGEMTGVATTAQQRADNVTLAMQLMNEDGGLALDGMIERLANWRKRASPILLAVESEVRSIANALNSLGETTDKAAVDAGLQASNTNEGAAFGGTRGPGITPTHTGEFVSTDRSIGVLNARTASSLFSAVERLLSAGGPGNTDNSRRAQVTNVFNVQSDAQAAAAGSVASNVRGFG